MDVFCIVEFHLVSWIEFGTTFCSRRYARTTYLANYYLPNCVYICLEFRKTEIVLPSREPKPTLSRPTLP